MKRTINSKKAPAPIGPYSQAVMSGNMLYASGQIALDPESGNMINSTIEEETHQVMRNIKAVLNEVDLSFDHVIKCSIFISDMNQFSRINEVFGSYFSNEFPARETVEVSRLPKDANVEISFIASGK